MGVPANFILNRRLLCTRHLILLSTGPSSLDTGGCGFRIFMQTWKVEVVREKAREQCYSPLRWLNTNYRQWNSCWSRKLIGKISQIYYSELFCHPTKNTPAQKNTVLQNVHILLGDHVSKI